MQVKKEKKNKALKKFTKTTKLKILKEKVNYKQTLECYNNI